MSRDCARCFPGQWGDLACELCEADRDAERMWGMSMQNYDDVRAPEHYCKGDVECIDAIKSSMGAAEFRGYCKGNCMKYLWRYEDKGGLESLEKALVYLEWLVESVRTGGDA